jgi:hypothetical protein
MACHGPFSTAMDREYPVDLRPTKMKTEAVGRCPRPVIPQRGICCPPPQSRFLASLGMRPARWHVSSTQRMHPPAVRYNLESIGRIAMPMPSKENSRKRLSTRYLTGEIPAF